MDRLAAGTSLSSSALILSHYIRQLDTRQFNLGRMRYTRPDRRLAHALVVDIVTLSGQFDLWRARLLASLDCLKGSLLFDQTTYVNLGATLLNHARHEVSFAIPKTIGRNVRHI